MGSISRRQFAVSICASVACVLSRPAAAVEVPNLEETLRGGLKPRTPQQNAFLRTVVALVDDGLLPLALVHKVFLWARRQDRYNAFRYFEVGIKKLALREGIRL